MQTCQNRRPDHRNCSGSLSTTARVACVAPDDQTHSSRHASVSALLDWCRDPYRRYGREGRNDGDVPLPNMSTRMDRAAHRFRASAGKVGRGVRSGQRIGHRKRGHASFTSSNNSKRNDLDTPTRRRGADLPRGATIETEDSESLIHRVYADLRNAFRAWAMHTSDSGACPE